MSDSTPIGDASEVLARTQRVLSAIDAHVERPGNLGRHALRELLVREFTAALARVRGDRTAAVDEIPIMSYSLREGVKDLRNLPQAEQPAVAEIAEDMSVFADALDQLHRKLSGERPQSTAPTLAIPSLH